MKNQFVTYEIALKLKELGFDEYCFAHYCNGDLITKTAILKSSTMQYYQQNNINPSNQYKDKKCTAPLWQQAIDWCDSKGLLVGTIVVDNLYKSTINKINYETELFHSRNESIKRAIEFAISYLQDNK